MTEFERKVLEELRKMNWTLAKIAEQTKPTTYVQGIEIQGTIDSDAVEW